MITFLLITLLVISLGFNIALLILSRNLHSKMTTYEQWILEFKEQSTRTLNIMRAMDKQGVFATSLNDKGIFESDDQVGQIFKDMMDLIEKLNQKTE